MFFVNKTRKALQVLVYDGQDFWLCYKRLSRLACIQKLQRLLFKVQIYFLYGLTECKRGFNLPPRIPGRQTHFGGYSRAQRRGLYRE